MSGVCGCGEDGRGGDDAATTPTPVAEMSASIDAKNRLMIDAEGRT